MTLLEAIIDNKNVTPSTMKNLKSLQNFMAEFLTKEMKKKDVPLKSVDQTLWKKFQEFSLKKGSSHNYIITQVRYLNAMVKRNQVFFQIPAPIKIVSGSKPKHKFLTTEQMEAIKQSEPSLYRDWFLFQCYTGMAFDDLKRLSKKSIIETEDGPLLEYIRGKTEKRSGEPCRQPIDLRALDMLFKYKYTFTTPYSTYNDGLKRLGEELGFPLSTHMARHTFGTNAVSDGWPLEQVKVMMAHSSILTTQRYAFANTKSLFEMKRKIDSK